MPHEQAPAVQVPVEAAYAAAEERAVRTTKALILAEAQVLTLQARVRELEQAGRDAAGRELTLRARVRELEEDEQGEVKHDAAQDNDGAAAGGEAGEPHPFHD